MLAVVVFLVILLVLIPVGFLMSTSVAAGVLGFLLKDDAERRHVESPLVDLND
jgi:hypothetical protein